MGGDQPVERGVKNVSILSLDKASASTLRAPGTCTILIEKFPCAAMKNRSRNNTMRDGSRDDWPVQAWTTDKLSQWKIMRRPINLLCQVLVAARMENSYCHWMERCGSLWWGS